MPEGFELPATATACGAPRERAQDEQRGSLVLGGAHGARASLSMRPGPMSQVGRALRQKYEERHEGKRSR